MKITKSSDDSVSMVLSKTDLKELQAFLNSYFFIPKFGLGSTNGTSLDPQEGIETFDKLLRALNLIFGDEKDKNGN